MNVKKLSWGDSGQVNKIKACLTFSKNGNYILSCLLLGKYMYILYNNIAITKFFVKCCDVVQSNQKGYA